jgi:hypothetical protein
LSENNGEDKSADQAILRELEKLRHEIELLKRTKSDSERSRISNFAYALGAVVMAVSGLSFSFAQIIAESLYYQGRFELFDYYWFGSSCIMVSGVLIVVWGYLVSKYYRVTKGRKVSILHRFSFHLDLTFQPKTDILGIIAIVILMIGVLALSLLFHT